MDSHQYATEAVLATADTPQVTTDGVLFSPESIALGFLGLALAVVQWLVKREMASQERRVKAIEDRVTAKGQKIEDLENSLAELRVELPQRYVAREEFIRCFMRLEDSMNAVHRRLDQMMERIVK